MSQSPFKIVERFADAGPSLMQRLRHMMSAANLWATLRTLSWLVPLTILAWFYAARSVSESKDIELTLVLRSGDPNRVVSIQDPRDGKVRVTVAGPQSEVDQMYNQYQGQAIPVTLQATQVLGTQNPDTRVLLRDGADLFKGKRVQPQRTDPQQVTVLVDELVERSIPVRKPESVKNLESAVFEPAQVTIRAAARDIAAAEAADKLFAEADIAGLPQLKQPGKKDPMTVPVRCPLGTPTPASVTATLDVRSDDVAFVLLSVPVFASLPPSFADQWKVTLNPTFLTNVRVLGPPDAIELLKKENGFPYRAYLDFLPVEINEDLPIGRSRTKKPTFVLPPGVTVDPVDLERLNVEWSLTSRSGG